MLLLGLDVGTSSVKASVVDSETGKIVASASYPEKEAKIIVKHPGWAEQNPLTWWEFVKQAILKCHIGGDYNPRDIAAIGIAYQMHGLVMVDRDNQLIRDSIIWADSRSVEIGNQAFRDIGAERCLTHLLNSPGNFTASKLAWVKRNEPDNYDKIGKIMLPGDFIAMKFTGDTTTTISALSEGIFWDFKEKQISEDLLHYFGFDREFFPTITPLFSSHGILKKNLAQKLNLKPSIPVTYKSGDQPNNALALNVMNPGEVAATAGTSGVIYGVSNQLKYDKESRINSFAHVNYSSAVPQIGILLNINGVGIFNNWIRKTVGEKLTYEKMNVMAESIPSGSEGLLAFPFGNGAERMLNNRSVGSHILNIDFNRHNSKHLLRATQEGVAFSFRLGFDIMKQNGIKPEVIRVSRANLFLSPIFAQAFADLTEMVVEFYEGDGSYGAAMGAGIGLGIYGDVNAPIRDRKPIYSLYPKKESPYLGLYENWKKTLFSQFLE